MHFVNVLNLVVVLFLFDVVSSLFTFKPQVSLRYQCKLPSSYTLLKCSDASDVFFETSSTSEISTETSSTSEVSTETSSTSDVSTEVLSSESIVNKDISTSGNDVNSVESYQLLGTEFGEFRKGLEDFQAATYEQLYAKKNCLGRS